MTPSKIAKNRCLATKHRWFNGRMLASQAGDPGSIPGRCSLHFIKVATIINPRIQLNGIPWKGEQNSQ